MPRGFTLRTYLWLAGSLFILASSLCFLAYLRLSLPWWAMVVALGLLIGAVVEGLGLVLAQPLERLAHAAGRTRGGLPVLPAPPEGWLKTQELQRLWRGMRQVHDHLGQVRRATRASEGHVRLLALAARALEPEQGLDQIGPALLGDLGAALDVGEWELVPRHDGGASRREPQPDWADVAAAGLAPWQAALEQGEPVRVCLAPSAPAWREHWGQGALWVVPLCHRGRPEGVLLSRGGTERLLTSPERSLLAALAPVLACALAAQAEALAEPALQGDEADETMEEAGGPRPTERKRRRRRRHMKGA